MPSIVLAPIADAVKSHDRKTPVGTKLRSRELESLPRDLRNAAQMSAGVESARVLQGIQDKVSAILSHRRNDLGGLTDRGAFIADLMRIAEEEGLTPADPAKRGTIEDITSEQRLALIYEMQTGMAYGYANWRAGNDPDALDAFPAQELVRARQAKVPRNWSARWAEAGHKTGWAGAAKQPHVALKSSPIWRALSRFDNPWPPFDYNSGMWVEDIGLEDATCLGFIKPGDKVELPKESFTDQMSGSLKGVSPELRAKLQADFGDKIVIQGDEARWAPRPEPQSIEEDDTRQKMEPRVSSPPSAPESDAAARDLGIKARYPSEDVGKEANKVFSSIKEDYGYAPRSVETDSEYFRVRFGERASSRTAAYDADVDTIWINPDSSFWKNRVDRSLELHTKKVWSSPSPDHPILHEVGHALHARKSPDVYKQASSGKMFLPDIALQKLHGKVSKYALSSVANFIAETFAGLRYGNVYDADVLWWYNYYGGP